MRIEDNAMTGEVELPPEQRDQKILASVREFFIRSIPAFYEELLAASEPRKLLSIYVTMMNANPTADGFRDVLLGQLQDMSDMRAKFNWLEKLARAEVASDATLTQSFKKFLFEKLPRELLKTRAELLSEKFGYQLTMDDLLDELSVEDLLAIHDARTIRTVVGFHVSRDDVDDNEIKQSRYPSTVIVGGERVDIPAGYSHYNLNPAMLYKGGLSVDGHAFLYLVEGSVDLESSLAEDHARASGKRQWHVSPGPLPVRLKIELTPGVTEELGLGFA